MYSPLVTMIDRLAGGHLPSNAVLDWSSPVPFFGDAMRARVATLGINPSNQEFVDSTGRMLAGAAARLPTLESLHVSRWGDVGWEQLRHILLACRNYFRHNPYDTWFRVLERILSAGGASFYGDVPTACHLDLVPYATRSKWGSLATGERSTLLSGSADLLATIIRDSPIRLIILNGRSVVGHFQRLVDQHLVVAEESDWQLARRSGHAIVGHAYTGMVTELGGIRLEKHVEIIGYNHNLQSSFGVTRAVIDKIASWASAPVERAMT